MTKILAMARRIWVPVFIAACVIYLFLNAGTLLRDNPVPALTHPQWLLIALPVQIAVWMMLASGWQAVMRVRVGWTFPLSDALIHFAIFSAGKYLPGKIWGAAARGMNMGRQGVSAAESLEGTVHEQFLVLHSAAVVSALLLPFLMPGVWPWALAGAAVASAPLGGVFLDRALPWVFRWLRRDRNASRPGHASLSENLSLVAGYAAAWLLHGAVLVLLHAALAGGFAELDTRTAGLLMLANTLGMLAGFAAIFAPAGLGVREAAMAAVLASAMPLQHAVTLSVAMRLWTVATDLGLGGLVLLTRRWG